MREQDIRTAMLLGEAGMERLRDAGVIIFGVGGVGSYVAEALARTGVGHIALVDSDVVAPSNINRQLIATHATLGQKKVDAAAARIREINPNAKIETYDIFFENATKCKIDFTKYDYIADAIDSVPSKILLIECAKEAGIPIISSMGTGNKLDPSMLRVSDISKTRVCPLARAVRTRLRKAGINHLKVVYSEELPREHEGERVPASVAFVPGAAGLIMASEIVRDLIK